MSERFLFLGAHPAVDLVNTQPVLAGSLTELLVEPRDLAAWLGTAGIASPSAARRLARSWEGPKGRRALEGAVAYRETLRSAFQSVVDGGRPPRRVITATNRLLRALPFRFELADEEDGFALRTRSEVEDLEQALGLLARSAADLLVTQDLSRLRRCANPECVLFFLDLTRSRTRRWCSMAFCGNRAKQRGFQRRRAASTRRRAGSAVSRRAPMP